MVILLALDNERPIPEKVEVVQKMKVPETKTQVRQVLGFFSYFRDYIRNFAMISKPITDLTAKRIPNRVPWGETQNEAFVQLKQNAL